MLPWAIYSMMSIIYLAHTLNAEINYIESDFQFGWFVLEISIFVNIAYMLYLEVKQFRNGTCGEYFTDFYNVLDLLQYLGSILIVSTNMARINFPGMPFKRNIAVFIVMAQCGKVVLDWLRLF